MKQKGKRFNEEDDSNDSTEFNDPQPRKPGCYFSEGFKDRQAEPLIID